jgi:2-methylcitrate dehydratase PrpD
MASAALVNGISSHTIDFDDRKHASKALRDRAQAISENR